MRAREFLKEAEDAAATSKKLGRAFNHLEDLVFFHGSAGTMEALEHVREIASEAGSKTVRMKWDGNPQIYWGRAEKNGPLVLAGHNGWSRGALTDSPEAVKDFITNKSGSPKTPDEKKAREQFAQQFANLYPLFDRATPKDFVGYVYADGLFLSRPQLDQQGVYTFCPNPKSQTCYHVRGDSPLGQRISQSQVMVVGHAFYPEFGMDDSQQKPIDDFSNFNSTRELIVQGPVYNSTTVSVDDSKINEIESYLQKHADEIDTFLQGATGLGDLKNILYMFVNQTAKAKQLDNLGVPQFFNWLKTSKVSVNKQSKIQELAQRSQHALSAIFGLVKQIMDLKDEMINQIESGAQGEIWDTQGEGRVRYAPPGKQFGNVKLVPRKRWTPQ
jgi:hypothetical protein